MRTREEIMAEMFATPASSSTLPPWTFWDKFVHRLTGHVSNRVYAGRMAGLLADDRRRDRWEAELAIADSAAKRKNEPS